MGTMVRAGAPAAIELHAETAGEVLGSCSIAIAEPPASIVNWQIRVEAILKERAATRELGNLVTIPPSASAGAITSRIVAIANCPGARGFRVTVFAPSTQAERADTCDVELGYLPSMGCCEAVWPIPGHAQLIGERYDYLGDTLAAGANAFVLPAGIIVQTFSAWQVGTGAVMSIDGIGFPGQTTVPLPPDGSAQLAPHGTHRPVGNTICRVNAVPAGGGGVLIEYTT